MKLTLLFNDSEIKEILNISDCELMHRRVSGKLNFEQRGAAYFYKSPDNSYLLNHPLAVQLINWYQHRHEVEIDNRPTGSNTKVLICDLLEQLLIPVEREFGDITISYGFTSAALNRYIQKNSPAGTCPAIDQHSGFETNKNNNAICQRGGLACDFKVAGFENKMEVIAKFIVDNLCFDKLYYYGADKPIHLSISAAPQQHLQIMNISKNGRRIPGKKAFGDEAKLLAAELQ